MGTYWLIVLIIALISYLATNTIIKINIYSLYFVIYQFEGHTGNIYIKVNSQLTSEVITQMKKHIVDINNLHSENEIAILNIIKIKE
jgi:hypothetical protein